MTVPVRMFGDVHEAGAGGHLDADLLHDELGKVLHPLGSPAHAHKLKNGREIKHTKIPYHYYNIL